MEVDLRSRFPTSDVVYLDRGDGTSVLVHLYGATIISWKCQETEILFLSKDAVFDNKKAIRGGIPIVFPHFGPWEHGPQHGFARISRWNEEQSPRKDHNGDVICMLSLEDDDHTRARWNYKFKLVYTLVLMPTQLSISLSVHNTCTEPDHFEFTTLMHTYFRTPDITQTAVIGLQNLKFVDKVHNGDTFTEDRKEVKLNENYDRVYMNSPEDIIVAPVGDEKKIACLKTFNCPDIVVWNPWDEKAKAMSDFGDEEYKNMICVEAGFVSKPVALKKGENVTFSQVISITSQGYQEAMQEVSSK